MHNNNMFCFFFSYGKRDYCHVAHLVNDIVHISNDLDLVPPQAHQSQ